MSKKDRIINEAAHKASLLFITFQWEWARRETVEMYTPDAEEIEVVFRELVDEIESHDPVDGITTVATGRLAVSRWNDEIGTEINLYVDLESYYHED